MIDAQRRQELATEFARFLPSEDLDRHPTYRAICRGVADDTALLELADLVPPPQAPVNVLLASVHHLLLEGVDHPLGDHYRSVCARRGRAFRMAHDDEVAAAFAAFCHEHRDPIAERCAVRATQTNEVGRCAALRAAIASLGKSRGAVGLLDAGCSAGLNLLVDAYRYDYGAVHAGPPGALPAIPCELWGAIPPLELPWITARVGLDLAPIDVADDDAVTWLLACLWPDDLARFERLDQAIALVRERRGELAVRRGDMVEDLAGAATAVTAPRLVVVNSWSASYLPDVRRRAYAEAIASIAATRPTTWVSMEFPTVSHDLGVLEKGAPYVHRGASVVCVTEFDGARASSRVVAETHPHGRWLAWRSVGALGGA